MKQPPAPQCIRIRGARQNNLKGIDLDIPLGRCTVVTGLSGAGKSSLVFDTLHAEGQRRYVETFSAYTRQFLELLPQPKVDSVENIRPSIAISQGNTVRTSRSTVGTMTELTDYFKVWFSHVAACHDPETGRLVEDDTPQRIWQKLRAGAPERTIVVSFKVEKPAKLEWQEILSNLKAQGYLRILLVQKETTRVLRSDEETSASQLEGVESIYVAQDRLRVSQDQETRFLEAAEVAMQHGRACLELWQENNRGELELKSAHSRGLHSPETGRSFRPSSPSLFSFNSPIGACPRCRGFGRVIDIDLKLAIPDRALSIDQGAIKCWEGDVYSECLRDLRKFSKKAGLRTDLPFNELPKDLQDFVIEGEPGYGEENGKTWPDFWYGIKGFFKWLEKNAYKMHVRVFLSRYRSYDTCPECQGTRLQPEALCWKWQGRTLPELYTLPVSELLRVLPSPTPAESQRGREQALEAIRTRLGYLEQVGLGYLSLDRQSRTLSGGETERVNLTGCLGSNLVDTLFVLDEPSVGLHPRDIHRLNGIIGTLTRAGNTVVVVEHDEAMMRAADHLVEIGPEPGARGGRLVFSGTLNELLRHPDSLTGAYLSGKRGHERPTQRRRVKADGKWLRVRGASKHNIHDLDVDIPLGRLVCLAGVSGSGKSTLLEHVLHQGLQAQRGRVTEDPAKIRELLCEETFEEIILVDQSPLSKTPRSNPALYCEAWDPIRKLLASTPEAKAAGFNDSSFSFNAGEGRCDHCQGLGFERVEMQFLSDVFVPCPSCEGRRFKDEVLAVTHKGKSVADILGCTLLEALELFADREPIKNRLAPLCEAGLGYLTLGQPLNTLSGGEAQRLKLASMLGGGSQGKPLLLLLDEPTTGLHRHDVARLCDLLDRLAEEGHSLVVIEHNTDVLARADWIIETGPEAGPGGGHIVAEGTPEQLAAGTSPTAGWLAAALYPNYEYKVEELVAEPPQPVQPPRQLSVIGARENNLRNIDVHIPHGALSVVTGVSGSGKSTLAFDIVFAEGQRRFMESMSPYARQFVEQLGRPSVDLVTGIPPTVAIEQRVTRGSRKSTVATITEVAQYLRLLYARLGIQHHPETGREITPVSGSQLGRLLEERLASPKIARLPHLYLCAPLVRSRKGHHQPIVDWMRKQGYTWMRADGKLLAVEAFTKLDRYKEHDIEVVISDLGTKGEGASAAPAALRKALDLGKGSCFLCTPDSKIDRWYSTTRTDEETGEAFPDPEPKHFSHNSPKGWCPLCRGHGKILPWMLEKSAEKDEDEAEALLRSLGLDGEDALGSEGKPCPECRGARLNRVARAVKLHFRGREGTASLPELLALPASKLLQRLEQLKLDKRGELIMADIRPQIEERLRFLGEVGLAYLSMDRATSTLSGGEAQRIRLAAQLGSNLTGVLYVLDEPSIGLHAKDNERLIETLLRLRDRGNTLLVVEHDDELMLRADHLIDLGPGAGVHGGRILAEGSPKQVQASGASLTGMFLKQGIRHPWRGAWRACKGKAGPEAWIEMTGIRFRNIEDQNLRLPMGRLVMVAGPSGAGKSSLLRDLLHPALEEALAAGKKSISGKNLGRLYQDSGYTGTESGPPFEKLSLGGELGKVIEVDQSPIGKTPRSTPATYLGILDTIRSLFATVPEARMRACTASTFSFNTKGGRCPVCEGAGRIKLEMAFMPETYLPCEACGGTRYGPELSDIRWNGKNIGEILAMSFDEALEHFAFHNRLRETCQLMVDCGLGYLTLGQSSPTLSGGEAQRLKLITELSKGLQSQLDRNKGKYQRHLYLLEEPTIGLHLSDCEKLIRLLQALVDQGHSVVVIEHHLDLLAEADWLVELGPGGGPEGGRILGQGPVEDFLRKQPKGSPTARFLATKLGL